MTMLLKKTAILATISISFIANTGVQARSHSHVADNQMFYTNVDLNYNHNKLGNSSNMMNGQFEYGTPVENSTFTSNIGIGKRWGNIGLEFGYNIVDRKKVNVFELFGTENKQGTIKTNNFYLDTIYQYGTSRTLSVFISSGIGYLHTNIGGVLKSEYNNKDSQRFGLRVGTGMQWQFLDYMSLRLNYNYQTGNNYLSALSGYGLGLIIYL